MVYKINLTKIIDPNSLRGIGQRPREIEPHQLPIAGLSIEAILTSMNAKGYSIGRVSSRNAFAAKIGFCIYIYVNPNYAGYRRIAMMRFQNIPDNHDIDHILAKHIATQINYKYVLIALIPQTVNRAHGVHERYGVQPNKKISLSKVIFPDERIFHKILARNPTNRQNKEELKKGFDRGFELTFGLTLKQSGLWNIAFGLDVDTPQQFENRLKPL